MRARNLGPASRTVRWNIVEECLCLQCGYIKSGNRIFEHIRGRGKHCDAATQER
jgi:hypothetical protein